MNINNLFKLFVRSGVKQVGRDGGRVISNKVYKGKHSKPIYYHDPNTTSNKTISGQKTVRSQNPEFESNESFDFKSDDQPNITEKSHIAVFLIAFIGQIIPLVFFVTFWFMIKALTKRYTPVYAYVPNKVQDKRYKQDYRIDGNIYIKTNNKRLLSPEERKYFRIQGLAILLGIIAFYSAIYVLTVVYPEILE